MTCLNISSLLTSKNCQWVLKLTSKSKSKFRRIRWYKFYRQVSSKLLGQKGKITISVNKQCFWLVPWVRESRQCCLWLIHILYATFCPHLLVFVAAMSKLLVKLSIAHKICTFPRWNFHFVEGVFNWSSLTYLRLILGKKMVKKAVHLCVTRPF